MTLAALVNALELTGRTPEQAVVCVNQGLLNVLDDAELEGVIAHELTHIRNYDVRLMTYATVLAVVRLRVWPSPRVGRRFGQR